MNSLSRATRHQILMEKSRSRHAWRYGSVEKGKKKEREKKKKVNISKPKIVDRCQSTTGVVVERCNDSCIG